MSSPPRKTLDDVSNAPNAPPAEAPWRLVLGAGAGAPWPPPLCPPPPAGEVRAAVTRDGGGPEAPSAQPAPAPAEWLASRTGVRVGATVEKRFPGYGTHRGTVVELGADDVVVKWETDERTTLSIKEASRRVIAAPARKTERVAPAPANGGGRILTLLDAASAPAAPHHILLQNCGDDDDDAAFGITSSATSLSTKPQGRKKPQGKGRLVKGRTETQAERRARVVPPDPARGYTKSSKFWGVSWHKGSQLWRANYLNKDNRLITIGNYATEAEAALAVNKAVSEADGIVGVPNTTGRIMELKKHERRTNAVDATGAPVPMPEAARNAICHVAFDRSKVVPPDPARIAAGLTPSRFYHVHWSEPQGRWSAGFKLRRQGEGGKTKNVGLGFHDTEHEAALAVNAALGAIPPDVRGNNRINPVDANGKLVPPPDRKSPHPTKDHKKRKAADSVKPKPLSSWTVDELKAFCRSRNLRVSGLKAELVQRIVDDARTAAKPAKKKARRTETPPLPVREKVIKWKLSGSIVAATPIMVVRPAVPPVVAPPARAAVPPVVTPRAAVPPIVAAAVPPVVAAAVPPVVAAAGPPVVTPPAALPTAAARPAPDADADGFHAAAGHLLACLDLSPLLRGGADANAAGQLFPPPTQYESA